MKSMFSNLRGDVFGGLTAGIVALPLALAFGVQSGLGAEAGLYGAIFVGFFASLFGGTPSQISGPTGPITLVVASVFATYLSADIGLDKLMALMLLIFIFTGLFQILFGIIRLGKYIKYIPYPVLSGFMSGIGIIIILLQIFPLTGQISPSGTMAIITEFPTIFDNINLQSIALAAGTIVIIYSWPLVSKKIPGTLIALLLMTIISVYLNYDSALTISTIPEGMPTLKTTYFSIIDINLILLAVIPALTLAGLGSIDSLLTSVVADNLTNTKHNSNKELIGQGIGNIVAGFFGGIPGAGATMRTLVNVKSGGREKLSGLVHSLVLLLMLLGLGTYVKLIPNAVLAGILITVGIGIIDKRGLRDILKIPKADAVVLMLVLLLTVFVDLLQAVAIGMVIASVLFMKRAGDLVEESVDINPVSAGDRELPWDDEKDIHPDIYKKVHILRLDGPLFFGVVNRFRDQFSMVPPDVEVMIIRMRKVAFIDQSGLYAIEDAVRTLKSNNVKVLFTMIQEQPLYMMKRVRMIPALIEEEFVFDSFSACAEFLQKKYDSQ